MKFFLLLTLLLFINVSSFAEDVLSRNSALPEDLYCITVDPFNSNIIFAGSGNSIFKSSDNGNSFKDIFTVQGYSRRVNRIIFNSRHYQSAFIATDSGLYVTDDLGKTFSKVFKSQDELGNYIKCLSIAKLKDKIYLGTNNGLYMSDENIYNFTRVSALPQDAEINDIKANSTTGLIILATSRGVFLANSARGIFKRTFVSSNATDLEEESEDNETSRNTPRYLYIDANEPSLIYLGTSSGLFISNDSGASWNKFQIARIEGIDIRCIAKTKLDSRFLYLATDKGFYRLSLQDKILNKVYSGLSTEDIRFVDVSEDTGCMFLATPYGLYEAYCDNEMFVNDNLKPYFSNAEPSYLEVQEVSLKYNDIHPAKTKRWQTALKFRALVPSVSLDYDKTITYDSGADTYYKGPYDWGVKVSWDLADLIWNTYEDDIDTRIRLNTQTRLDILDDVRRIYFERKKLCSELINNPPDDQDKLEEKKLYLEELTAALDGYTGGYFSRRIRQLEQINAK